MTQKVNVKTGFNKLSDSEALAVPSLPLKSLGDPAGPHTHSPAGSMPHGRDSNKFT